VGTTYEAVLASICSISLIAVTTLAILALTLLSVLGVIWLVVVVGGSIVGHNALGFPYSESWSSRSACRRRSRRNGTTSGTRGS